MPARRPSTSSGGIGRSSLPAGPAPERPPTSWRRRSSTWEQPVPLVALPAAPGNAYPAEEVAAARSPSTAPTSAPARTAATRILLSAAFVIRAAREAGHERAREKFVIFPAPGGGAPHRAPGPPPRGRFGAGGASFGGGPDPGLLVRPPVSAREKCAPAGNCGPSPRSTGTGRTGWAAGGEATWRARRGRGIGAPRCTSRLLRARARLGRRAIRRGSNP